MFTMIKKNKSMFFQGFYCLAHVAYNRNVELIAKSANWSKRFVLTSAMTSCLLFLRMLKKTTQTSQFCLSSPFFAIWWLAQLFWPDGWLDVMKHFPVVCVVTRRCRSYWGSARNPQVLAHGLGVRVRVLGWVRVRVRACVELEECWSYMYLYSERGSLEIYIWSPADHISR